MYEVMMKPPYPSVPPGGETPNISATDIKIIIEREKNHSSNSVFFIKRFITARPRRRIFERGRKNIRFGFQGSLIPKNKNNLFLLFIIQLIWFTMDY